MTESSRWRGAQCHYEEQEWAIDELEPAWAKASLFFRSGCRHHFGHGPDEIRAQSLPTIAMKMRGIKARFDGGHDIELLHAIRMCADENLPLPTWVALAFKERFGAYVSVERDAPTSLDAALLRETAPATPAKLDIDRRDWVRAHRLWEHVTRHASEHAGLTPAVEAAIAQLPDIGVRRSKALEMVQMVESVYQAKVPGHRSLNSRFRPNRRKKAEP